MSTHDVAVIGGGCVGCSIVKHLSERNSDVLHLGFDYTPGSLKAGFSTEGTDCLKAYAREHDVALEEYGVLVVARSEDDVDRLDDLHEQATANGVTTEVLTDQERIEVHMTDK